MAAAKFLEWAMFWTFEKRTSVITFNPADQALRWKTPVRAKELPAI